MNTLDKFLIAFSLSCLLVSLILSIYNFSYNLKIMQLEKNLQELQMIVEKEN